jgi:hypothetical protein
MDQLMLATQDAFDVDSAIGVQLDVVGAYAGVTRYGYVFGALPADPLVPYTMSDAEFRSYITIAIAQNKMGSSLYDIQQFIADFFTSSLRVYDYKTMRLSYEYIAALGAVPIAEFFVNAGRLPKPNCVGVGSITFNPAQATNFFGFQTYVDRGFVNHGMNKYTAYDANCPFLEYTNAL